MSHERMHIPIPHHIYIIFNARSKSPKINNAKTPQRKSVNSFTLTSNYIYSIVIPFIFISFDNMSIIQIISVRYILFYTFCI